MTDRRSYLLAGLAVFAVAVAMRTIPLYWSPLPHYIDGFAHAAHARQTVAAGQLPISPGFRSDQIVIALLTASASLVTGERPLYVIQPLFSVIGAVLPLVGMAFTRRLAADLGWPARQVRAAALATGLLLAVQGLFLRHSSIADAIPPGQLFAFLVVLCLHRVLHRRAAAVQWTVLLGVFIVTFPMLHTFSGLHAALGLTALAAAELARRPTRRTAVIGIGGAGAFWAVYLVYYDLVERLGILTVPYIDRVEGSPGLFLAWVVVALVGVAWVGGTSRRVRRGLFCAPLGAALAIVAANFARPIFPGTIGSPLVVVAGIALLAVPVLFAAYAADALSNRYETATLVAALVSAPIVVSYFSLTASLTPEFFATVQLSQAFVHVPVFVLVGLGAAGIAWRSRGVTDRRGVRAGLLAVLAVSTLLTVPIAFVSLATLHAPDTTLESEFEAVEHASTHTPGAWTTDKRILRVGRTTFDATVSIGPTRTWVTGGPPPGCPMLTFDRWVTHGANFWPATPASIDRIRYEATLAERQVVYTSTGWEAGVVSIPRLGGTGSC